MVDEVVDTEVVAFRRDVKGLVIHFFLATNLSTLFRF